MCPNKFSGDSDIMSELLIIRLRFRYIETINSDHRGSSIFKFNSFIENSNINDKFF